MSTAKKAGSPKKAAAKASHPPFQSMIKKAISSLKEKGGSSQVAILKYILANYKVGGDAKRVNSHLRLALKRGVKNGLYLQPKGPHGKFKLSESKRAQAATTTKPKVPRKSRAAGTPKKASSPKKKAASASKPKKAKSPAKAKKATPKKVAKSPAKPKAAAAAKSPKAKKSPGKVGRPKSAKKSHKKGAK